MKSSWLRVARAPGASGRRLLELLPACGGIEGLLALPESELKRLGLPPAAVSALKNPDHEQLAQDAAWLDSPGHHLLSIDDDHYPPLLKRADAPPSVLFLRGNPDALWQPQVAMVGSRNPTAAGQEHARAFAAELGRQGWSITSGLAAGIDAAAHQGALAAHAQTVAVLGTGPDLVYPAAHEALAGSIAAHGALVTEYPPGTPARRGHFPARNRIIAGLSLGVLVVEAALNSGSLITARLAAEQGREVFALPGSLHSPLSRGCHRLIKEGARLAEDTGDVLFALAPMAGELAQSLRRRLSEPEAKERSGTAAEPDLAPGLPEDPHYRLLWKSLGHDPATAQQLMERTGLAAREVSSMLLMLELRGLANNEGGGRFSRGSSTGKIEDT